MSTSTGISGCLQPGQAKVGPGPTPLVSPVDGNYRSGDGCAVSTLSRTGTIYPHHKKEGLRYTKIRKDNVEFWRAGWVADFLAVLLKAPFAATCNPPNVP